MSAFVIVLVVVSVIGGPTNIIDTDLYFVVFPIPFVTARLSIRRIKGQIGKCHPVKLDASHPFQPLLTWSIRLLDPLEQRLEDKWAATEKDGVVLEQNLEGFSGNLSIKKKILVVEHEQDGCGTGFEMLEVAPLDAQSALTTVIFMSECIVIDLYMVSIAKPVVYGSFQPT